MPAQRWSSGETSVEKKRSRRLAVIASAWGPWLLPFVVLGALLAARSSIVHLISDSERTPAASSLGGAQPTAAGSSGAAAAASSVAGGASAGATATSGTQAAKAASAAAPPRFEVKSHCSNTCFKANDGVCNEGRPPSNATLGAKQQQQQSHRRRHLLDVEGNKEVSELLCDLGTDCVDCGPWVGTVPTGWGESGGGPVSWMRTAHNASLFVRRTATPRPFLAAITHHGTDPDVSAMLWHYGAMEGGITRILHHVLNGQCQPEGAQGLRRLVVDVGANFGYYTIQAALYGCRVVAFEPVAKFRAVLDWSAHAAGVAEWVHLSALALSDREGPHPLVVPKDGSYWGLASVHGVNVLPKEVRETLTVNATTLDLWEAWAPPGSQPEDLLLVKMDIEGWEANVLRGGSQLLAKHGDNVLLEYSPGIFERNNMTELPPQVALPETLLALATTGGFRMAHLPLFAFAAPWPPKVIDPNEPLPAFEEITATALQHDLEALAYRRRMEMDPGGCPLPSDLGNRFGVWKHCREWTYGTHPKGFRSAFGFNTNVWAARRTSQAGSKLMRLEGVATLFDEGQNMKVWTSQKRPNIGMGLIDCTAIGAGHLQLFRCPCRPDSPEHCKQEQELVLKLAAEGKMPFTA